MPLISGDGPDQDQPAKIGESKRQVGAKLSWPTSPSARSRLGSERKRTGNDVAEPSLEDWERQDQTVIAQYYEQTALDFFRIINEYFTQANAVTILYKQCVESHARWRFWMIIAMGILAVINVCAALDLTNQQWWGGLPRVLNVIAAVYAGCLTVAGNVESFLNWSEKAIGFREARDLLLNRYREYRSKWVCYVDAYGKTPNACMNAGRLYRQLVESDQELQQKLKTVMQRPDQPGKPAGGH